MKGSKGDPFLSTKGHPLSIIIDHLTSPWPLSTRVNRGTHCPLPIKFYLLTPHVNITKGSKLLPSSIPPPKPKCEGHNYSSEIPQDRLPPTDSRDTPLTEGQPMPPRTVPPLQSTQLWVGGCHANSGDRVLGCLLRQSSGIMKNQLITVTVKWFIKLCKEKYINVHHHKCFSIHQAFKYFLILSRNKALHVCPHLSTCPNKMTSIGEVAYINRSTGICLVGQTKAYYLGEGTLNHEVCPRMYTILRPDAESFPDATV